MEKIAICFDYYCPRCKKRHVAQCDPDYVTDPKRDFIMCICEKQISTTALIYLYKTMSNENNTIEIIK